MVWGTLGMSKNRGGTRPDAHALIPLTYTGSEFRKAHQLLTNERSWVVVDTNKDAEAFMASLDTRFGTFFQIFKEEKKVVLRGKFDYHEVIDDPATEERFLVFSLSDPKVQYRENVVSPPHYIRVPFKKNLRTGFYAEVVASSENNDTDLWHVEPNDIEEIDISTKMPNLFMDYHKIKERLRKVYQFELHDSWARNLTNLDLLFLPKVSGENFGGDVRGGVSCSIVNPSRGVDSYDLESINILLNSLTICPSKKTLLDRSDIQALSLQSLLESRDISQRPYLDLGQRDLSLTRYTNGYTCNLGWSASVSSYKQAETFIEKLGATNIDVLNPIENITTPSQSKFHRKLKKDSAMLLNSRILFLTTKLHPIKVKVAELMGSTSQEMRIASSLRKYSVYDGREDDPDSTRPIRIDSDHLSSAAKFLKDNKKDTSDFISRSY